MIRNHDHDSVRCRSAGKQPKSNVKPVYQVLQKMNIIINMNYTIYRKKTSICMFEIIIGLGISNVYVYR